MSTPTTPQRIFGMAIMASTTGRNPFRFGNMNRNIRQITITGDYIEAPRPVDVDAGAAVQVWLWERNNGFHAMMMTAEEPMLVYKNYDRPVSATNLAPSGTMRRTYPDVLRPHAALVLSTQDNLLHPTLSKYAEMNGIVPGIADGNGVWGRLYSVTVVNLGSKKARFTLGAVGDRVPVGGGIQGGGGPAFTPFTVFQPWQGIRTLYVRPDGNDASTGLSDGQALATPMEALTRLMWPNPNANVPSQAGGMILIKAGTTFANAAFRTTSARQGVMVGGTAATPVLIGVYGDGPRPIIQVPQNVPGMNVQGGTGHYFVQGIEFRGELVDGLGTSESVTMIGDAQPCMWEDCVWRNFRQGPAAQGQNSTTITRVTSIKLRRCIVDYIRAGAHCHGTMFSGVNFAEVDECVFNNIGNRDRFSHGWYWVADAQESLRRMVDSIVIDPGNAGGQCRGGRFEVLRNLIIGAGNGLGLGHAESGLVGISGDFDYNWIVNPIGAGDDNDPYLADVGIAIQRGNGANLRYNRIYGATVPIMNGGIPPTEPLGIWNKVNNFTDGPTLTFDKAAIANRLVTRPRGVWGSQYRPDGIAAEIGANS